MDADSKSEMSRNYIKKNEIMNAKKEFDKMSILSEKDLSNLKGGTLSATSSQVDAVQMGNSSCCNISIERPKK